MSRQITYPHVVRILQDIVRPGDRVLEIGCGSKQYRPYLPSATYAGLDLPESTYLDSPPEYPMGAESLNAPDGSFDVVFGVATFCLHPDPAASFRQCHRVLTPGGLLLVFDYIPTQLNRLKEKHPGIHAWNFPEMRDAMVSGGFDPNHISDISNRVDYDDFPSVMKLVSRQFRRHMGIVFSNWMIALAKKNHQNA